MRFAYAITDKRGHSIHAREIARRRRETSPGPTRLTPAPLLAWSRSLRRPYRARWRKARRTPKPLSGHFDKLSLSVVWLRACKVASDSIGYEPHVCRSCSPSIAARGRVGSLVSRGSARSLSLDLRGVCVGRYLFLTRELSITSFGVPMLCALVRQQRLVL